MFTKENFEGIVLSEMSDRKTNIMWSHLYIESKEKTEKIELIDINNRHGC